MLRCVFLLLITLQVSGCYYLQAAGGQWEVLRKRESVAELIDDPNTPGELAARLQLLSEARNFSISSLGLPDNNSYRTYTALDRDYVIWNVFAAPEFSLTPKHWCFPVAGCVNYRGYFSKARAVKESVRLSEKGFDVAVGGVAAYSTLGKFDDPILSSMMHWDDNYLVATLFHELAHQVLYIKDDSAFNESFATAVEEIGLTRWLESRGSSEQLAKYFERRELRNRIMRHVESARMRLEKIYDDGQLDTDERRAEKHEELHRLVDAIRNELTSAGVESSTWLDGELNNARLISSSLYQGLLPAFRRLYAKCEQDMQCFYDVAQRIASLEPSDRVAELTTGDLSEFGGRPNN